MPFIRRAAPLAAAFVVTLLGLYAFVGSPASPSRADEAAERHAATLARVQALRIGEMRDLNASLPRRPSAEDGFEGPDGAPVSLAAFRGKVTLVNFWATWCAPCLRELPSLDRLAAAMASKPAPADFALVAVNIDRNAERGRKFMDSNDINTLAFYHDAPGAVMRAMQVTAMPTTLLLDRDGLVVARYVGEAEWDSAEARAVIEAVLEEGAGG